MSKNVWCEKYISQFSDNLMLMIISEIPFLNENV